MISALARLLGDTKAQQEEKMKARLARLKELKAEREDQGMAADDDTLADLVDKEETRKDALETRRGRKRVGNDSALTLSLYSSSERGSREG